MGDQPRCTRCGGDRLAVHQTEDGELLCATCNGEPSLADRFQEKFKSLEASQREALLQAFDPKARTPQ